MFPTNPPVRADLLPRAGQAGEAPVPPQIVASPVANSIRATCAKCGNDINALAAEGKIKPVILLLPNGGALRCNSAWAATDYLKANKFYDGFEASAIFDADEVAIQHDGAV